ncbi:hypothetical protein FQN54_004432 [Arachnomyces sp. PD_36]|nr:hypothetical protein FQN54_004432 [Arachnomyces sp. PD_36]
MAQIPTPPVSPQSENLRKASPEETLDALLERYLHLLDRHQQLQAELGKQLASGFFSLTQANYSCPPGRRYGEDYYDERMKAIRTISIDSNSPTPTTHKLSTNSAPKEQDIDLSTLLSFQTLSLSEPSPKDSTPKKEEEDTSSLDSSPSSEPSEDSTPPPESETRTETETETETKPPQEKGEEPKPPRNPLSWYGILVPPSLRSAQGSFTTAVEGTIPALAAIMIEMRDVERRVEDARRRKG